MKKKTNTTIVIPHAKPGWNMNGEELIFTVNVSKDRDGNTTKVVVLKCNFFLF
jgi:hypothetical protein